MDVNRPLTRKISEAEKHRNSKIKFQRLTSFTSQGELNKSHDSRKLSESPRLIQKTKNDLSIFKFDDETLNI